MVEYRDSLATQSDACARTAKKLLEIASAATGKDLALPERCNQCRQPVASGTCGFYVAHWIDAKMREVYNSEPKMSTGNPQLAHMKKRLMSFVDLAKNSLEWLGANDGKMDAHVKKDEMARQYAEDMAKAIKASLDMQEQVMRKTQVLVNKDTWDAKWGCPKCGWAPKGSTCCNPHKHMARIQAEDYAKIHGFTPTKPGKMYDEAVYDDFYAKIRQKILEEHAKDYEDFWRLPECRGKDVEEDPPLPPPPAAPAAEDAKDDQPAPA